MTDRKPNFLFIMTDQHRADWLGCAGHPVVRTPNIDLLAARGTMFTDFHVASPVCMPNRASFMTGRYPSVHGLRYNGCLLPRSANTFVDVLRAGGYRTASIGKSHLQPFTAHPPIREEVETGLIAEAWKVDDQRYDLEQPEKYEATGPFDFPSPYYGFDHVDMVTGHGDKAGGHYQQWFRARHADWQAMTNPAAELSHNYSCPQAFRTPIPEDSYPTAYIRDSAAAYLRENAGSDAPLFTYVSFPDPHHPFNPPGRYWDMYAPTDFTPGPRYEEHRNPPPPLVGAKRDFDAGIPPLTPQTSFYASDQHVREAMALTAGMITMIDDSVGALIEALKETGQFENTIVVFNADHGDYLGSFNMMLKGAWAHESISRVPMIWADPMNDGQVQASDVLASTVDLAPTILARAGLTGFHGMQGEDLLPCLSGAQASRDHLLVEYNDGVARQGFEVPARVRTLLSRDWRLSLYKDQDWGELYDRQGDPHQTNNLWNEPGCSATRAELTERLAHLLVGQMDESPRSERLA